LFHSASRGYTQQLRKRFHSTMSCKGIGGTSVTEPWLVQQTLEESSHQTSEREQGFIPPRINRENRRKLQNAMNDYTTFKANTTKVPICGTIGHYPKAKSNSSLRVKGLQLLTSVAGLPLGKKQRRRTRARQKKMANYGSIEGIPMGHAKLRELTMKNAGSWHAPQTDLQKQEFVRTAKQFSVPEVHIKGSPPIFFCGDGSGKIDGIPKDAIVRNVCSDLLVIDTVHGFKFPFAPSQQNDIVMMRRTEALEYEDSRDYARLLDSFNVLSNITKNKGIVRGKKRIVAFQEGSNCKYLTPGICPLRAETGTSVRALFDLDVNQHDALFRYVRKCEKLAFKSMSLQTTRGFNVAKQFFPFRTFPGRGNHDSSCHAFSSIATALNVCLNSHTDDDSFYGVVTNLDADPLKSPQLDDEVTLYFTFPTLGLAIALRPGDILVFNPDIYHSVSSRCNTSKNIWCTSLYTKNAVVGGNDNSRPIETAQKEAIDTARSIIQESKKK
jgi:hypothetical protein